jgi:predicted hotdog family 3-hydroxylacyl-ACP dehydratase
MRLDHAWIAAHIPHQGSMCLLDEVIEWSADRIRCRSATHRSADNPLRAHDRLGVACGIEYAAQAMAVHGALRAAADAQSSHAMPTSRPGMLTSVRSLRMHVDRLDDVAGDLYASATYMNGDSNMVMYEFSVGDSSRTFLEGRATIAFANRATASATP